MRKGGAEIGDRVDVEEHRARNMAEPEFGCAQASGVGQMPGAVDHPELGVAELGGELVGGAEIARGHRGGSGQVEASAMRTRRLILPFFSIWATDARPISPV